jgi:hypothetical protein
MQTVVPEVTIARATIARIGIGQLTLGPLQVGELIATDVRTGVRSGRAELSGVRVTLRLRFLLRWSLRVPLPWPFPDITITEQTSELGSLDLPLPSTDAEIPGLRDIDLRIPQLRAAGVVTEADPLTGLELTAVQADGIRVFDLSLPTGGFQFGGLSLTGVNLNDVAVPGTSVKGVSVRALGGNPIRLPALRLRGLQLPEAVANDVSSGPFDLTVNRPDPFPVPPQPLPLGVLRVQLRVEAGALTRVAEMRLSGVRVGATARTVELRDVTVPFGATQLTLADLGLDVLEIPLLGVA